MDSREKPNIAGTYMVKFVWYWPDDHTNSKREGKSANSCTYKGNSVNYCYGWNNVLMFNAKKIKQQFERLVHS